MTQYYDRANKIYHQINELAATSETAGMITRTYGSAAFVEAGKKIIGWMQAAGLSTRTDNIHNIRGRLDCSRQGAPTLILASHFDTVVNAGKFDGPMGILMGLDLVSKLIQEKTILPFNIELIAFCDEEGVRFHTTYLGSKVIAGTFDGHLLSQKDQSGIALQTVIEQLGGNVDLLPNDSLAQEDLLGYFEIHIEQGPVLYACNVPVALVTAIAGQQRAELIFTGEAGHAGTVPMDMRQDALCCAAECITAAEAFAVKNKGQLVATVGKLDIANAASNVIPGQVTCTLDVRSRDESVLLAACDNIKKEVTEICQKRNISFTWRTIQQTAPVHCDAGMNQLLKDAIVIAGHPLVELVSGAGHDAVPVSAIWPVSMLFVRCFKGISHNPLEDVEIKDMAAAVEVADQFLLNLTKTA